MTDLMDLINSTREDITELNNVVKMVEMHRIHAKRKLRDAHITLLALEQNIRIGDVAIDNRAGRKFVIDDFSFTPEGQLICVRGFTFNKDGTLGKGRYASSSFHVINAD